MHSREVWNMATLPQARKASKVFRVTLRDEVGTLTKIDGALLFFNDCTGDIVPLEPEDCVWLCVLGEMGLSEGQALLDRWHGGPAKVACTRAQEVA
jgi:hypothetical protein